MKRSGSWLCVRTLAACLAALTLTAQAAPQMTFQWEGVCPEKVPTAPEITIDDEAPNGGKGYVATVTADGEWQGMKALCKPPIDLSQYSVIAFDFMQDFYPTEATVVFSCKGSGGGIYTNFVSGPPDEWHHVEIPLDPRVWTGADKQGMIKVSEITIYPFLNLKSTGQYQAIANLRFVPKSGSDGVRAILPRSYQYGFAPTKGDDARTALTDGNEQNNAFWQNYANGEPEITFDLGTIYAVTKLQLIANPDHPEQNFNSAVVQVSMDGKDFHAAGAIGAGKMVKGRQIYELSRPLAGRYVRIYPKRRRQDFPVWIAEVKFSGYVPSAQELQEFAAENYDEGRPLPPDNGRNYAAVQSGALQFKVCKENGVIADLRLGEEKIANQIFFQYTWEDKPSTVTADSWTDRITDFRAGKDQVRFTAVNAKYPQMRLEYTYRIDDQALRVTVGVKDEKGAPRKFFSIGMNTVFSKEFRKNGVYETWGAAHALIRLGAADVVTPVPAGEQAGLIFENYGKNLTLMQFQDSYNGVFLPPGSACEPQQFLPNGMRSASACLVLGSGKAQEIGFLTTLDKGTELAAYDRYLDRPEMRKFMESLHRPAWLRDVKLASNLGGWEGRWTGAPERVAQNVMRCYEYDPIVAPMWGGTGFNWGDFTESEDGYFHGHTGNCSTAEEAKALIARMRAIAPILKLSYYTWIWSVDENSRLFKAHPEWFVTKTRSGAVASFFPGSEVGVNYLRLFAVPAVREWTVNDVVENVINRFDLDNWYLDGGGVGTNAKDWDRMLFDDPTGLFLTYQQIRDRIQKVNPERSVFFNTPYNPQGDFGYLESFSDIVSNWRSGAAWMYKFKLFQHRNPLHYPIFIYWIGTTNGPLQDYMLGTGLFPDLAGRELRLSDVGYISARHEVRQLALADADPQPNWRSDGATDLELMTLKQAGTGYAFVKLHGKEAAKRKISFLLAPMGLDPAKPVHQWLIRIKDGRKFKSLFGEPALRKGYEAGGWIADRVVTAQYCGTAAAQNGRFETELALTPNEGTILALSQTPAVVWSYRGRPAYSRLAGTPAVQITGDYPELTVNSEAEGTEIALIVPENQLPETIRVNGQDAPWQLFQDNGALLAIVKVGAGKSTVNCAFRAEAPLTGSVRMQAVRKSKKLQVKATLPEAWVGKTLLLSVVQDQNVFLSRPVVAENKDFLWLYDLPSVVRGGRYQVRLTPAWGSGLGSASCSIYGMDRATKLEPTMAEGKNVTAESPAVGEARGMKTLKQYTTFTQDCGTAAVDPAALRLEVGSGMKMVTYWNQFSAGLELEGVKRYLKVRCFGNLQYANTHGTMSRRRHFVRYDNPGCFLGIMLDFGTAQGYAVRTVGSYGICNKDFQGKVPSWGYQEKPQHVWMLNDLMTAEDANECTLWLDLQQLGAPEDWNGRLLVSAVAHFVAPERRIGVEILETADRLPAGADTGKPVSLRLEEQPQTFAVPKLKGKYQDGVWAGVPALGTLLNVNNRVQKDPNPVTVKAAYDDQNLYVFFDNREASGKIFENADWIFTGDSVEMLIGDGADPAMQFHLIFATDGKKFLAKEAFDKKDAEKNTKLPDLDCKVQMNTADPTHWTAVITLPFRTLGIRDPAGKTVPFNLMRNRKRNGALTNLSLAPKYYSGDFLKLRF